MTILREDGYSQRVCCDSCGAEHENEYHERAFNAMITAVKRDGWRVLREDGEWHHYCPDPTCDTPGGSSPEPKRPTLASTKRLLGVK